LSQGLFFSNETFFQQCSVVSKPRCHVDHERVCSQVVETVCRQSQQAPWLEKGHIEKGSLLKGLLEKGHFDKGHSDKGHFDKGHTDKGHFEKGFSEQGHSEKGSVHSSGLVSALIA